MTYMLHICYIYLAYMAHIGLFFTGIDLPLPAPRPADTSALTHETGRARPHRDQGLWVWNLKSEESCKQWVGVAGL